MLGESEAREVSKFAEATKLLLAHSWNGIQDLAGWWCSEKL